MEQREIDEGPRLVLASLESDLRRRSDQRIKVALQVAVLRIADDKMTDAQICAHLDITPAALAVADDSLRELLRPG